MNVVECDSMHLKNDRPLRGSFSSLYPHSIKGTSKLAKPVRDNLRRNITIGYRSH